MSERLIKNTTHRSKHLLNYTQVEQPSCQERNQ